MSSAADSTSAPAPEQEQESSETPAEKVNGADKPEQPVDDSKPTPSADDGTETPVSTEEQTKDDNVTEQEEEPPQEECNNENEGQNATAAAESQERVSPLQEKIIRQMEFYFGDRNYPKDKFLQQAVESSTDGWVPLTTLLTFNRLKTLSSDGEVIAAALRKATAGIVQVSEDSKSVRRHPNRTVPDVYAPDFRKDVIGRSIYAKGFPEDTELDQIQEFMEPFGQTHYIQMRRIPGDKERKFKGSVFAEFVKFEDAEKFVKSEKVQFKGNDLITEWKADYFKRKQEEKKQKKEQKSSGADQSKKKDAAGEGEGGEGEEKTKPEPVSLVKVRGCVLHFTGLTEGKSREDIREDLLPFGTVAFVDFDRGKTEGYVRFREEGGAGRVREGLLGRAVGGAGVAQLCGCDVELRVLESEEEEQYWQKVMEGSASGREKKGGGRRGGRGGGRGRGRSGRGNFRKRRDRASGDDSAAPESKAAKTEN